MVGYPALREVIGADSLASVARAHKAFALFIVLAAVLRIIIVVKARTEHFESLVFIFELTALVLAGYDYARGKVGDSYRRFGLVYLLPAPALAAATPAPAKTTVASAAASVILSAFFIIPPFICRICAGQLPLPAPKLCGAYVLKFIKIQSKKSEIMSSISERYSTSCEEEVKHSGG